MNRRDFLALTGSAIAVGLSENATGASRSEVLLQPPPMPSAAWDCDATLTRIALGSCYVPQFETPGVWNVIASQRPQVFLYMGDNVYQSEENARPELRELRDAYAALAADRPFAALRARTPVMVTWDDHDYGQNNAGAEFPARRESETLFKQVWAVPADDPRSGRDGVYYRRSAGPAGRTTQLIVLDTRYFRTAETMLGEEQWRWLEDALAEPADLRVLVSSIPVLMEAADGESWKHWPRERTRLLGLLAHAGLGGRILVSGDSHFGAFYRRSEGTAPALHELTASSLNFPMPESAWAAARQPDPARIGEPYFPANFGMLLVDWDSREVAMDLHASSGELVRRQTVRLPETAETARPAPAIQTGAPGRQGPC